MNHDEAEVMLHALLDGELDAGHARTVEAHVAQCARCAAALRDFRSMRGAIAAAPMAYSAPASLRGKLDRAFPSASRLTRRGMLRGFGAGAALGAIAASGLTVLVLRKDDEQRLINATVTAHLRSLQGEHLIDVESGDRHTVKPWFNGKLDAAPPVVDLTALGFRLIGGRLDYVDAKPVAAIVYRRRMHVINLFVSPDKTTTSRPATMASTSGFNVRHWRANGLAFWAVSDLNADELTEFGEKFEAAARG